MAVIALVLVLSVVSNYCVWRMIRADVGVHDVPPAAPLVLYEIPNYTFDYEGMV